MDLKDCVAGTKVIWFRSQWPFHQIPAQVVKPDGKLGATISIEENGSQKTKHVRLDSLVKAKRVMPTGLL